MSSRRVIALATVLVGALAAASAGASWFAGRGEVRGKAGSGWAETAWPFAIDEWGTGKAYHCAAADCGHDVTVYLRGKLGFCNCTTGVADDAELDRLSDFQLFGGKAAPLVDGQLVTIAWMKGRSRPYVLPGLLTRRVMISIAFSDECDALVATAVLPQNAATAAQPQVIAFLNSVTVQRWAKAELGR